MTRAGIGTVALDDALALDAAFRFATASVLDMIAHYDSVTEWFPREVEPVLLAKLHTAFADVWNVALDQPVEVPR